MTRATLPLLLLALLSTPAAAKPPAATPPPSESGARARLEASPRHGEFVEIAVPGEASPLQAWIAYPERADRAGVVILLHEIFGLSEWMRGVADQVAADGWIAVAPDLISGFGPDGGGTASVASRDSVVQLVRRLKPDQTDARLAAVREWARALPSANGKLASLGFCWGGSLSFKMAAVTPPIDAAVVFYGSAPDSATLTRVRTPVLGLYGGDDARVNSTIEPARAVLRAAKRRYDVHVYDGAGHGFLRQQELREGANQKAADRAWPAVRAFLTPLLR